MSQFLYIVRAPGAGLAKVGMSIDPKRRFSGLSATAMHALELAHVFEFSSVQAAAVWEKRLLTHANRTRDSGEWVVDDARLVELISEIPQGCATGAFYSVSKGRSNKASEEKFGEKKVSEHLYQHPEGVSFAEFRGAFKGADKRIIEARLAAGFGVEDIAAKDGISADQAREHIEALRQSDDLTTVLFRRGYAA